MHRLCDERPGRDADIVLQNSFRVGTTKGRTHVVISKDTADPVPKERNAYRIAFLPVGYALPYCCNKTCSIRKWHAASACRHGRIPQKKQIPIIQTGSLYFHQNLVRNRRRIPCLIQNGTDAIFGMFQSVKSHVHILRAVMRQAR
ncbi:hypothetical protein JCM25156A_08850 [Komagataeibacter kakiaceti JCM 25156]